MGEYQSRQPPHPYLRLRFAGQETCKPGHAYGLPRDHYILHLVENGQGTLELAGEKWQVQAPASFLIPPFEGHRYTADLQNPWSYSWVGVDGPGSVDLFADCGFARESPVRHTPRPIQARDAIAAIISLFRKGMPAAHTEGLGHFHLFCAQLQSGAYPGASRGSDSVDARIMAACDFIQTHYPQPLTTGILSDQVGLERSYFCKVFSRHMGMGPHHYLLKHRMRVAEQFLEKGGYSLREVAKAVGYEDYATFERAFRRLSDLTPRAFARKFKEDGTWDRGSKPA